MSFISSPGGDEGWESMDWFIETATNWRHLHCREGRNNRK